MDKEKIEAIQKIVHEIHKINFDSKEGIIRHSDFSYGKFSFNESYNGKKRVFNKDSIAGYCDECKEFDSPKPGTKKEGCRLCNISHGSHTFDFLEALGENPQDLLSASEWIDIPVLFLMENPSLDYKIYDYINSDDNRTGKRPAKQWYWIHQTYDDNTRNKITATDDFLVMSKYGEMVVSLIYRFKLGNAYLTNIVKCGMSNAKYNSGTKLNETVFLGTDYYQPQCIQTCIKNILTKEIQAICHEKKELIVFAFGGNAHWYVKDYFQSSEEFGKLGIKVRLYQLPHPAGRMKNEYRPYVLKGIIDTALHSDGHKIIPGIETKVVKDLLKGLQISEGAYSKYHITYKIWENNSIFDSNKYIRELRIRDIKSEGSDYGAGYNFNTDEFWAWDYGRNEYIEFSDFRQSKLLESIIRELLANPTKPNIENIKLSNFTE